MYVGRFLSICPKQYICCMIVKVCFERLCLFIAFFAFSFHLLVKLFTLPAVFDLVHKDLQMSKLGHCFSVPVFFLYY